MGEYLVLQPTNWPLEHEAFDMKTCSVIIAACLAAGKVDVAVCAAAVAGVVATMLRRRATAAAAHFQAFIVINLRFVSG